MRFNYLKGLISSALCCSIYANARVLQTSHIRCVELIDIYKICKENSYGIITELEIRENAYIRHGLISRLNGLEKLVISGEQSFFQQYYLNEISSLTYLKELRLTSSTFSSSLFDMSVISRNTNLSYLELSGFNSASTSSMSFRGLNNLETLNLSNYGQITQENIYEISEITRLNKMMIQIDDSFSLLDISALKAKKSLTSLYVNYKESNAYHRFQYSSLASAFEGFIYLNTLQLNSVKLSQSDITAISSLTSITNLSMINCDFNNAGISSLDNLNKLKYFKLLRAHNIRGQTLTNKSLVKAEYQVSRGEFCITKKMNSLSPFTLDQYNYCKSTYKSSSSYTSQNQGIRII